MSFSRVGLRWTWVSMIAGITVLPARSTRVAPAGAVTLAPACTILPPSTISVPFSTTLPSPTISRAPSYAVTAGAWAGVTMPASKPGTATTAAR